MVSKRAAIHPTTRLAASRGAMSYLERRAAGEATEADYQRRAAALVTWLKQMAIQPQSVDELDVAMTDYMDELFARGDSAADATKLLAAVRHYLSQLGRFGNATLPRVGRALRGFRLAPPRTRPPLPWAVAVATVGAALGRRHTELAAFILLGFAMCPRPGELPRLTSRRLVPPRPAAGRYAACWGFLIAPRRRAGWRRRGTSGRASSSTGMSCRSSTHGYKRATPWRRARLCSQRPSPDPLLCQARRGVIRHSVGAPPLERSEASRQLAKRRLSPPLRKGGGGVATAELDELRLPAVRPPHRAPPGLALLAPDPHPASAGASGTHAFLNKVLRAEMKRSRTSQVFLDLFASTGRVAAALRARHAVGDFAMKLDDDARFDLERLDTVDHICGWISPGCVAGVMVATPSSSWSRARRGVPGTPGGPLRSSAQPLGVASLPAADQEQVRRGNVQMRATVRILKAALRFKVPAVLENPCQSILWQAPALAALCRSPLCRTSVVDMCAFGARWRKRTKLVAWHADLQPVKGLCQGAHGMCSFSARPHIKLERRGPGNVVWTRRAQAYPTRLAAQLGRVLSTAADSWHLDGLSALILYNCGSQSTG